MKENDLAQATFFAALKVHKALGPGLLESAYQACLCYELTKKGLFVEKEKEMPVIYDEIILDVGYRLDLVVEKSLIIELKSVEMLLPIHKAQLITYLKLSGCKLGLLVNFNVELIKDGFKRIVYGNLY
jgi:GxxExxY protein